MCAELVLFIYTELEDLSAAVFSGSQLAALCFCSDLELLLDTTEICFGVSCEFNDEDSEAGDFLGEVEGSDECDAVETFFCVVRGVAGSMVLRRSLLARGTCSGD